MKSDGAHKIAAALPYIHPCTVGGKGTGKFAGYAFFSEAPTDQQHSVKQSLYAPMMYLAHSTTLLTSSFGRSLF